MVDHRLDNIKKGHILFLVTLTTENEISIKPLEVINVDNYAHNYVYVSQKVLVRRHHQATADNAEGIIQTNRLIPQDINTLHEFTLCKKIILTNYTDVLRWLQNLKF